MNNPVVLYNLMIHALMYEEYDNAIMYAKELDEIVGYDHYILYIQEQAEARSLKRSK